MTDRMLAARKIRELRIMAGPKHKTLTLLQWRRIVRKQYKL